MAGGQETGEVDGDGAGAAADVEEGLGGGGEEVGVEVAGVGGCGAGVEEVVGWAGLAHCVGLGGGLGWDGDGV